MNRRLIAFALAVASSALAFWFSSASPPLAAQGAAPGVVAIRNATVLTATRGTINNGTVLIRDG